MQKTTKEIVHRVEGEVELKLIWEDGKVKDAYIIAPNFRGFEFILEGKPPLDALVITPRICGICGHAHLMATVNALENVYINAGYYLEISEKAKLIRKITLGAEIVQNHIRWFYLFVFPDMIKLEKEEDLSDFVPIKGKKWQKAIDMSQKIIKVIAILGGQWPHTSYSVVGGVVSEPTNIEISEALSYVETLIRYTEEEILGMSTEEYFSIKDYKEYIRKGKGDLQTFLVLAIKNKLFRYGKGYRRFITVGDMEPVIHHGITKRKKKEFKIEKINEIDSYSYLTEQGIAKDEKRYSWAKAVRYEDLPCETGPLARRVNHEDRLFLNLIDTFKDTYIPRIWARVDEIIKILISMKHWLLNIDIKEPSYIKPKVDIKDLEGEGVGLCEAARGSLIHKVRIKNGKIDYYDIITPSVWNLGPRCEKYLSPAEKAIKGAKSQLIAEMILRSFDVCSVCTTH